MLIVMNILNLDCFEPTEIVAPGSHYVTCQFDYISNYNRLMHFRIDPINLSLNLGLTGSFVINEKE